MSLFLSHLWSSYLFFLIHVPLPQNVRILRKLDSADRCYPNVRGYNNRRGERAQTLEGHYRAYYFKRLEIPAILKLRQSDDQMFNVCCLSSLYTIVWSKRQERDSKSLMAVSSWNWEPRFDWNNMTAASTFLALVLYSEMCREGLREIRVCDPSFTKLCCNLKLWRLESSGKAVTIQMSRLGFKSPAAL